MGSQPADILHLFLGVLGEILVVLGGFSGCFPPEGERDGGRGGAPTRAWETHAVYEKLCTQAHTHGDD